MKTLYRAVHDWVYRHRHGIVTLLVWGPPAVGLLAWLGVASLGMLIFGDPVLLGILLYIVYQSYRIGKGLA